MIFSFMSHHAGPGADPARIASQIVPGIGFLGAGIILRSEATHRLTNVTTAASIWYSASVGMTIGFGYYFVAVVAALAAVVISALPKITKRETAPPEESPAHRDQ
jgi:putative Mg2+ transporter-C (MgtC) family protein